MAAAFTFDEYKLVEISYKPTLNNSNKDDDELRKISEKRQAEISISSEIATSQQKTNKYRMELVINVTGAVLASIRLFGYFSGTDYYDNEDVERQELAQIGFALLLPIARSILASVSAQDGSTPFLLPTVNVAEMTADSNVESAED